MNWWFLLIDCVLFAALFWAACRGVRESAIFGYAIADFATYLAVIALIFFGTLLQQLASTVGLDLSGEHCLFEHTFFGLYSLVLDIADGIHLTLLPSVGFSALGVVAPILLSRRGWPWLRHRTAPLIFGSIGFAIIQSCVDWSQAALGFSWLVRPFLWHSYLANAIGAPFLCLLAILFYNKFALQYLSPTTASRKRLFRRGLVVLAVLGGLAFLFLGRIPETFALTFPVPEYLRLRHAIVTPTISQFLNTKRIYEASGTAFSPLIISSAFAPIRKPSMSYTVNRDRTLGLQPISQGMLSPLLHRGNESEPLRIAGPGLQIYFGHEPSRQNVHFDLNSVLWADLWFQHLEAVGAALPDHPEVYRVHARMSMPGNLVVSVPANNPLEFGLLPFRSRYESHLILDSFVSMMRLPMEQDITFSEGEHIPPLLVTDGTGLLNLSLLQAPPLPNETEFGSITGLDFDVHGPLRSSEFSGGYTFADEVEVLVNGGSVRWSSTEELLHDGDRIVVRGDPDSPLFIELKNAGTLKVSGSFINLTINGDEVNNTPWALCDIVLRTGIVTVLAAALVYVAKSTWGIPKPKKANAKQPTPSPNDA